MSVVVIGIEMPSCCSECELNYDSLGCSAIRSDGAFDRPGFDMDMERLSNCPLRPLPEKHGRLIDADGLKETIDYYIREAGWDEKTNRVLGWVKDEFIDSEKTIVEAEGD